MPPSVLMPGNVLFEQCMSSPARQARHRPHVGVGWRMTASPGCTLVTPAPISRTHPAFSCPSVYGKVTLDFSAHWPSMMCRSVRHSPAPPTSTITSNGPAMPGSGTSSSTGCSR